MSRLRSLLREADVRLAIAILGVLLFAALGGQWVLMQSGTHSSGPALWSTWSWWLVSTRNVVWVVFSVLSISLIAGSFAGAVVAYGPKLFAGALGRLVELSGALPSLIIVGLWRIREAEPSIGGFIAVLAALKTIETARLISSETDRLSAQGFVIAARALGATKRRIFTVHVLPHLMSSLAVSSAFTAAAVIGLEAALSFVGLGLQGSGSWGALLGEVALGQLGAVAPGTLGLDPGAQTPTGRILLAWLSVTGSTLALYLLSRRAGQHLR